MTPEVIIAIVAAIIASVSAYFSWRSTKIADRAAESASQQAEIQQQLRIDSAQPYVWADVRPDDIVGTLVNLVIGNAGPTIATNVRISINPPLPAISELEDRASAAQAVMTEGLDSLPPGRTYTWPLGQGFNLLSNNSSPESHKVSIECNGPFGPVPTLTYFVKISALSGTMHRPLGSLHELTQAVRNLGKK